MDDELVADELILKGDEFDEIQQEEREIENELSAMEFDEWHRYIINKHFGGLTNYLSGFAYNN